LARIDLFDHFSREIQMKKFVVALFAGSLVLSSMSAVAADAAQDQLQTGPAQGETRTEKAKDYAKKKAHNTKVRTKRAGKKVKKTVANRKTTDAASVSESKPDATPSK
jgi:Ni/Co efflux regulator RcnB